MLVDPNKKEAGCCGECDEIKNGLFLSENGKCLQASVGQGSNDFQICLGSLFIPLTNSYFRRLILAPNEKKIIKSDFFSFLPSLLIAYVEENVPNTEGVAKKPCGCLDTVLTARPMYYRSIDPFKDNQETLNLNYELNITISDFLSSVVTSTSILKLKTNLLDVIFDWANSNNVLINGINPQLWRDFEGLTWNDLAPQNLTTSIDVGDFDSPIITTQFFPITTSKIEGVIKIKAYDALKLIGINAEIKVVFDVVSQEITTFSYDKLEFLNGYDGTIYNIETSDLVVAINGDDVELEITGEYRSINIKKYNQLQSMMMLSGAGIGDIEFWNPNDKAIAVKLLYGIN